MKHRARKRFGQNFLQSQMIIQQIVSSLHLDARDNVLEIGPGLGALTGALLSVVPLLTAIEIDRDLIGHLRERFILVDGFKLLEADALTLDYNAFGPNLRVIGNLPYNIATPLMLYLLSFTNIKDMHFMLQKEVALRLAAPRGTKEYGRLSVMMQYHCDVALLFEVPPESFLPAPKVDSAVVRLTPFQHSPFGVVNLIALERVVARAFSMRRKTLANNVKPLLSASVLEELGIDPQLRAEQISVAEFVRLANYIE